VRCLTGWLLDNLKEMKHSTGVALARIYGPLDTDRRGGAVTANFFDRDGAGIDHRSIEAEANRAGISLRTGCFCNPGAGEIALGLSKPELAACFTRPGHTQRLSLDDFRICIDGKASGAVRVSVGLVSNFEDVQAFLKFAEGLLK
jgi:molybdenum cofactor sulfurtransferase